MCQSICEFCDLEMKNVRLSDVCSIRYGKDHKKLGVGNIPAYGSGGIMRYVDKAIYDRPSVLIPRKGSLNNLFFADEPFWTVDTLFWTEIDDDKVLPKYLFYVLGRKNLSSLNEGTAVPSLTTKTLNDITIALPSIERQREIIEKIEPLESKIKNNTQINDNLFKQIQALYKSWFVDYLPFSNVKPASWVETDIYTLANIIYGAPFKSKQFNTDGVGLPIIRIRDLKEQQFVTYTTEVHPKGYLLQTGDIVIGMDGEFRPYIWGNEEGWLNQRVCVFENKRPNGKAFLYFTIKPLLHAIEKMQIATTVIHVGKKDFDALKITLPDEATLDKFDALTAPMMEIIASNSFENKKLAALRDSLLPKLMSGEVKI